MHPLTFVIMLLIFLYLDVNVEFMKWQKALSKLFLISYFYKNTITILIGIFVTYSSSSSSDIIKLKPLILSASYLIKAND